MKILINGINYYPELTGVGKYTGEMADWLIKNGHEVRVITAPPYYPAWKVSDRYSSYKYITEKINNISVVRCPLYIPESPSGIKRILHLISFSISSLPRMIWTAITWRPDVVLVLEPTFFSVPGACLSARLCGGKAWLHIQDFEVDAAFDLGLLKSPRLRKIVARFERWLMRRFDRVSTISEKMLEKLQEKGVESEHCLLFPNWVDTERIKPLDRSLEIRNEFGIASDAIVLLYSGNMGEKQGLELLIDVARCWKQRE